MCKTLRSEIVRKAHCLYNNGKLEVRFSTCDHTLSMSSNVFVCNYTFNIVRSSMKRKYKRYKRVLEAKKRYRTIHDFRFNGITDLNTCRYLNRSDFNVLYDIRRKDNNERKHNN